MPASNALAPRAIFREVFADKLFISQGVVPVDSKFRKFSVDGMLDYHPFCDDFGPLNMACVIRFVEILDSEFAQFPTKTMVYCVKDGKRELTNAIFLLGAFMIIKYNTSTDKVSKTFSWLSHDLVEAFRDATFSESDFDLTLYDCWSGLERGRQLGWIRMESQKGLWGKIDVREYEHYDDPLNADLHEIVPGKFIAFKGPKDLGGREYIDDSRGYRQFSPVYYISIFHELRVSSVVRLNEAEYDEQIFEDNGIRHHDLEFQDCIAPPANIVDSFFRAVDAAKGAVAVHCKAGLGRTGTLIALYLMRTHGFSARQAMGWLRIMRPGSVIGEQQHYLCNVESAPTFAAGSDAPIGRAPRRLSAAAADAETRPVPKCNVLAAQVAAGMQRQAASRIRASTAQSKLS